MRTSKLFLILSLPLTAFAASPGSDPRNTAQYEVLFDLEARGDAEIVNGYGAYVQLYESGSDQWFRYCENFDGKGLQGKPNPLRIRKKLLPIGTLDSTAYRCRDFTPAEMAIGQPLIKLGDRSFFAMKSSDWNTSTGGEIYFQIAKKNPILGSPVYRTLRVRANRTGSPLQHLVEAIVPRTGVFPSEFLKFFVSGSGIGLPNGISGMVLNPGTVTQRSIDLDLLEGPIEIRGDGKAVNRMKWPH